MARHGLPRCSRIMDDATHPPCNSARAPRCQPRPCTRTAHIPIAPACMSSPFPIRALREPRWRGPDQRAAAPDSCGEGSGPAVRARRGANDGHAHTRLSFPSHPHVELLSRLTLHRVCAVGFTADHLKPADAPLCILLVQIDVLAAASVATACAAASVGRQRHLRRRRHRRCRRCRLHRRRPRHHLRCHLATPAVTDIMCRWPRIVLRVSPVPPQVRAGRHTVWHGT